MKGYDLVLEVRLVSGEFARFPAKFTDTRIAVWYPAQPPHYDQPRLRGYNRHGKQALRLIGYFSGDLPLTLSAENIGPATSLEIRACIARHAPPPPEYWKARSAFLLAREAAREALLQAAGSGADDATVLRLAAEYRAAVQAEPPHA